MAKPDTKDRLVNATFDHLKEMARARMRGQDLKEMAKILQKAGRGKDSIIAHISPREAAILKKYGGSGTINPHTGLMEFVDDPGTGGSGAPSPDAAGAGDPGSAGAVGPGQIDAAPHDSMGLGAGPGDPGTTGIGVSDIDAAPQDSMGLGVQGPSNTAITPETGSSGNGIGTSIESGILNTALGLALGAIPGIGQVASLGLGAINLGLGATGHQSVGGMIGSALNNASPGPANNATPDNANAGGQRSNPELAAAGSLGGPAALADSQNIDLLVGNG